MLPERKLPNIYTEGKDAIAELERRRIAHKDLHQVAVVFKGVITGKWEMRTMYSEDYSECLFIGATWNTNYLKLFPDHSAFQVYIDCSPFYRTEP